MSQASQVGAARAAGASEGIATYADGGAATGAAVRRRRLSRKQLLGAAAGLAALIAAAAYGLNYYTTGQYIETTDDAYVGGDVTYLAPNVSGLITAVAVRDNQFVHEGDLLVQIDDRDFKVAVAKAAADVAGAQAALANLDATRTLQQALIAEAQAGVTTAGAQVALAIENQVRYAHLAASHAGTLQDAQTANTNLAQAQAADLKARAALTAAVAQLAVIDTQKQEQSAALAAARAGLAAATLNLGYTTIRAPIDGVIGDRAAHTGGYAQLGASLMSIVPARGLWVDANLKEDQLARVRPGEHVSISADILPGRRITGIVVSVAPASGAVFSVLPAENATGNFTKIVQRVPVRIRLDGDAGALGLLRPGLSVTAAIDTRS
jgi:membrane fusion protein (multidrug efflux system)